MAHVSYVARRETSASSFIGLLLCRADLASFPIFDVLVLGLSKQQWGIVGKLEEGPM